MLNASVDSLLYVTGIHIRASSYVEGVWPRDATDVVGVWPRDAYDTIRLVQGDGRKAFASPIAWLAFCVGLDSANVDPFSSRSITDADRAIGIYFSNCHGAISLAAKLG